VTVYVETNFVLEIALLQEEHRECAEILELCKQRLLRLVIPAFSLAEPYIAIRQKNNRRAELNVRLGPELQDLARTQAYHELRPAMDSISSLLARAEQDETFRLRKTLEDLTTGAEIIPLDRTSLASALVYASQTKLKLPDAIVLASILFHLDNANPPVACFLNKNKKDFADPDVDSLITSTKCRIIPTFRDGLSYIKSQLAK
jgi:predicted nucleic acid-binding protein